MCSSPSSSISLSRLNPLRKNMHQPRFLRLLCCCIGIVATATAACLSSGDQTTINNKFSTGGAGTVIQLCPSATILISASIQFSADNQEISTQGYPTGSTRATIKIAPGNNVATLIKGRNSGIRIKNIQLDGDRPNNGLGSGSVQIPLMFPTKWLTVFDRWRCQY